MALASDTAPRLEKIHFNGVRLNDADLDAIAAMLEARARIVGCKRIECLKYSQGDFDRASLATRIRLLRALLPSVKELPFLNWENAIESCFLELKAPYVHSFTTCLANEEAVFPENVLEAVPAIETLCIDIMNDHLLAGAAVLQPITAALQRGSLQNLTMLELAGCTWNEGDSRSLFVTLQESGCAKLQVAKLVRRDCAH